jgi:hypothetical protein
MSFRPSTSNISHIGDHHELDVALAEERFEHLTTAGPEADAADRDAVAGGDGPVEAEDGTGDEQRRAKGDGRLAQETTAGELHRGEG